MPDKTARLFRSVPVLLAFYALGIAVQWWNGTFSSEFGRYADEGMHYVTGLMIRDFLATPAAWLHPMPFAKAYYAHFPKIGLGNWPPVFPFLQALWSLPFGVARPIMLLEVQLFTALTAFLLYRQIATRLGLPSPGWPVPCSWSLRSPNTSLPWSWPKPRWLCSAS